MLEVQDYAQGPNTVPPSLESGANSGTPAEARSGSLRPGTELQGRYVIERALGEGGMGAVYLARQKLLWDRLVAIKEMTLRVSSAEERTRAVAQFAKEAQILATLDHPGLTKIIDYFEEGGAQYLVMDFVDGVTLEGILDQTSTFLEVSKIVRWAEELCDVLDYLHSHNPPIVFRDLKPSNIMLDVHGKVRLIDFGIAQVLDPSGKVPTFIKGAGTPGFSPVEQHADAPIDHRADIYALGATMYTLFTNTLPPMSMAIWIGERVMDPPHVFNADIPTEVEAVVMRMMALRKEDRYQSVQEARQALRLSIQKPDMTDTLHQMLATDELTGIYNRRYFHKSFPQEAARAQEQGLPLTVAAVDVDHLRTINHHYGHEEGNNLLVHLAAILRDMLPEGMVPVRYCGDVFLVLMPQTDREAAVTALEDLSSMVRATTFEVQGVRETISVTLSVGVASFPHDTDDPKNLVESAMRAVDFSKKLGHDRVSTLDDEIASTMVDLKALHQLFPCSKVVGRKELQRQASQLQGRHTANMQKARQSLALEGPDGYGKTRMLDEIALHTDPRYNVVVRAAGQPHLATQPFGMLVDVIGTAIRQDSRLGSCLTAGLDASQVSEVARLLPSLARFSLVEAVVPLTADERKRALVTSFVRMLASWAGSKALTLILDDFQWADPGTLEVLASLREHQLGKNTAVFLGVTPRDQYRESNPQLAEYLEVEAQRGGLLLHPLQTLDSDQTADMVKTILPTLECTAQFIQLVAEKSHGVPLLVEEILKFLIQKEKIVAQEHQVVVRDFDESDIPDDIHDILRSRMGGLDRDIMELVNAAAVIGERFTLDDLRTMDSSKNEGYLMDLLDRATKANLIEYDEKDPDVLRFASAEARQTIYDSMEPRQRARFHEQFAQATEQRREAGSNAELAVLSWHYERAGAMDRALEYAEQLVKQYSKIINESNHPLLLMRTTAAAEWPREVPLPAESYPDAVQLARCLAAGVQNQKIYGAQHRAVEEMMARGFHHLADVLAVSEALTYTDATGTALVNGVVLPKTVLFRKVVDDAVALLLSMGLKGVAFKRGLTCSQLNAFMYLLTFGDEEREAAGGWMAMLKEENITHIAVNELVYLQVGQKDIVLSKNGTMVIKEMDADAEDVQYVQQINSTDDLMDGPAPANGLCLPTLQSQLDKISGQLDDLVAQKVMDQPMMAGHALVSEVAPPDVLAELQSNLKHIAQNVQQSLPQDLASIFSDADVLCCHLESGQAQKVAEAAQALTSLGEEAVEPLFQLITRTADPRASRVALRVLERQLGAKAVCERLIREVFRTEYRNQTLHLLHALGHYRYPEAVRTIGTFICHYDQDTRRGALEIIERRHSDVYRYELMRALYDKDPRVCADAAVSLGRLGASEAVTDLVRIIRMRSILVFEEDWTVQKQVCRALGLIGDVRAISALVRVLRGRRIPFLYHQKHPQVRAAAAVALGAFNSPRVVRILKKACRDWSTPVRAAAKMALNRMQGVPLEDPH